MVDSIKTEPVQDLLGACSSQSLPSSNAQSTPRLINKSPTRAIQSPVSRKAQLEAKIAKAQTELDETSAGIAQIVNERRLTMGTGDDGERSEQAMIEQATRVTQEHMKMLMRYNQTKDVAMELLGMIAEREGKTVKVVMEERGVEED